jgi:hypothetical protein
MRHIILHHHIVKNAGSTLDYALAAQFGVGFANLEIDGNPIHENLLVDFLDRNAQLQAVSSHNFNGASFSRALRTRSYRFFDLALVRRPLERLLSLYKFLRRSPSLDLSWAAAELDIPSFVRLLIERHPHQIDNPQVNMLANEGFYGHAVAEFDLHKAWDRYRTFSLCAPVERYDEAMVVLEFFNSPVYLPRGLDMAYIRQNVSEVLAGEQNLRKTLGEGNYDWLAGVQVFDQRLWNLADAELNRRVALVPDFAQRLADFKERCRSLRAKVSGVDTA